MATASEARHSAARGWAGVLALALHASAAGAAPAEPGPAAPAPSRIAVLELRTREPELQPIAGSLGLLLAPAVERVSGARVLSPADLRSLLDLQRQRQLAGCVDDAACATPLLRELQADLAVQSELSRLADTWILALALVDAGEARVRRRTARTCASEAALVTELGTAVEELFEGSRRAVPPVARAARVRATEAGREARLDGSASYDPDGRALTYRWRQLAGPPVRGLAGGTAVASVYLGEAGTYRFGLVVSNGLHSSPEEAVEVRVLPASQASVEAGFSALFGGPAFAQATAGGPAMINHSPKEWEVGVLFPVLGRLRVRLGSGLLYNATQTEQGGDPSARLWAPLAAVGVRWHWPLAGVRLTVTGEGLLARGYARALGADGARDPADGFRRTLLMGGGAALGVEAPLWRGLELRFRGGTRVWAEVGTPLAFDTSRVALEPVHVGRGMLFTGLEGGVAAAWAF